MSKVRKLSKAKKLTNRRRSQFPVEDRLKTLEKLTELDQELKLYGEDLRDD